jgi:hypothetical protein
VQALNFFVYGGILSVLRQKFLVCEQKQIVPEGKKVVQGRNGNFSSINFFAASVNKRIIVQILKSN